MGVLEAGSQTDVDLSAGELKELEDLLDSDRFEELEQHCLSLLLKSPATCSLYHILGLARLGQQRYTAAIKSFHKFLTYTDSYADTYVNLAIAHEKNNQPDDAIDNYRTAITLAPDNALIYEKLGALLAAGGKTGEAIGCLKKAAELVPEHAAFQSDLGLLYMKLRDYKEAEQYFSKASSIEPDKCTHLRNLGRAMQRQDHYTEAMQCYKNALRLDPYDVDNHTAYGGLLFYTGDYQKAGTIYETAHKMFPDNAVVCGGLAAICHRAGNPQKALELSLNALQINTEPVWLLANLAEMLGILKEEARPSAGLVRNLIRCFEHHDVDSAKVAHTSSAILAENLKIFTSSVADSVFDPERMGQDMFQLLTTHLRHAPIRDIRIEECMTRTRCDLLQKNQKGQTLTEREEALLEALAFQGQYNEYIWHQSDLEIEVVRQLEDALVRIIRDSGEPDRSRLLLLSCYLPLQDNAVISDWALGDESAIANRFPLDLRELVFCETSRYRTMESGLRDMTPGKMLGADIADQHDGDYSYPVWHSLSHGSPRQYVERIGLQTSPFRPGNAGSISAPDVLIAGCGEGKQALIAAMEYRNSKVIAVDPDLNSLSMIKSRAEEFCIDNIEFLHAEITEPGGLNRQFDVIECIGVLHYLEEPERGLEVLLGMLKRGGFLKLGLYSKQSREKATDLRAAFKTQHAGKGTGAVRRFRIELRSQHPELFQAACRLEEFYQASALSSLLNRTHEHLYTPEDIRRLVTEHGLEFLGFVFGDSRIKNSYLKRFSLDSGCLDLENWHDFETDWPGICGSLYQFWCRKS